MLLKEYKTIFLQELSSIYDMKEIDSFFYIILEKFHALKRIDLALNPNFEIDEMQLAQWKNVVTELKLQKPIQYILGETWFYGLKFLVNKNVLIPRQETEELVDLVIENTSCEVQNTKLNVLDIGTGSGCIAISLAKNLPNSKVYAIDVSEKAIAVAKKNAKINYVEVNFIKVDILTVDDLNNLELKVMIHTTQNLQPTSFFDIIVSNPPYVRMLEKEEIKANVLENEPHLALFVENDDALIFYRKIAELAKINLTENGKLYFEINQYLGKETIELLENLGFKNIELLKDIYGNDRIISCQLNT